MIIMTYLNNTSYCFVSFEKNELHFFSLFTYWQIATMQIQLESLQPELVKSSEETERMITVIEKESAEVEATTKIVKADEAVANEQASSSKALKDECEAELAEAIPALEAAQAALDTLKVERNSHFFIFFFIFFEGCFY